MSDDPQGEVERDSIADKLRVILQSAANNTVCVLDGHKLLAEFSKPEIAAMRKALSEPPQAALRPSAGAGEIEALRAEAKAFLYTDPEQIDAIDPDDFEQAPDGQHLMARLAVALTAPASGVQTEALSEAELVVVRQLGHAPDPAYSNAQLAHRVLEVPDTGDSRWYVASAVTLAAAYLAALPAPGVREAMEFYAASFGCHAGRDGECNWSGCPQTRDGEPIKTGRHCPRDIVCGDPSCQAVEGAESAVRSRLSSLPAAGKTR